MASIRFNCPHCSQSLEAEDDMAGMSLDCPACSKHISVPTVTSPSTPSPPEAHTPAAPPPVAVPTPEISAIPLAFSRQRAFPLVVYCIFFGWVSTWVLPDRYFVNAQIVPVLMLALPSLVLAILTSSFFIRPQKFPRGQAIGTLAFTMLVGLTLLLVFQKVAEASLNMPIRNYGKGTGLVIILKVIGWAYESIHDERLIQRFFGFIAGVGLCEELTKLLPLFYLVLRKPTRTPDLDYRGFLTVGFFSGLGFGIGEAFYGFAPWSGNLSTDGNILRWFACVPSHAIYAVVDAAFLWILAPEIKKVKGLYPRLGLCAWSTAAVAVLHGIYDVLSALPMMGVLLDTLSILLMYGVVRFVAAQTKQPDTVLLSASKEKGIVGWVRSYETGKKRFRRQYIFAGVMILASLVFSSSEDTVRAMLQQNQQQQPYSGTPYYNPYQTGGQLYRCPTCGGSGYVTLPGYGNEMYRTIPCQTCGGTGVIRQ